MIVVKPDAGICNRMRVINSCIELQKRNSGAGTIKMVWEKNEQLNCYFDDIFQPIDGIKVVDSHKALKYFLYYHNNPLLPLRSKIKKGLLKLITQTYRYYDTDTIQPLRYQNEFWDNATHNFVINTYSEFYDSEEANNYQKLRPLPHLQALIENEVSKFGSSIIGVHIRRTDNFQAMERSPTSSFIKCISDLLKKDNRQSFFLSTDDPNVENDLRKEFGINIKVQENKDFSRTTKRGIENAIVDLYALSNTSGILGSYWSSFSRTAARIGRIPLTIIE